MTDRPATLGVAVVVFASTNMDDIFLLAAFFSDPRLSARSVVLGQFLGIGALVAASVKVAWASLAVPEGYTALLGAVPLALGLRKLWVLRRTGADVDADAPSCAQWRREQSPAFTRRCSPSPG